MRSREELAAVFEGDPTAGGWGRLERGEAALIAASLRNVPDGSFHQLTAVALPTLIPATPGWRLAVLGPDGDLDPCPIIAWAIADSEKLRLEPIARWHGQDGSGGAELNAGRPEGVVGIMAPGEELDQGWIEAGAEIYAANRQQEETEARHAQP